MNEVGRRLSQKGEISPIELAKVGKIADAIDKGNLDFAALFNCSGRQGFNLFDLIVSTAHASAGCPVLDRNGKLVAELTPKEREDCIRYLVAILDEYGGSLAGGENGDIRVPAFVKNAASWLRWVADNDDETVIKLAQVPGAAIGLVREVAVRKILGEERYAEFERTFAPLVEAGELFGEALDVYLAEFKQKHNIPDQDAKDFALVVKAGSATAMAAIIGSKAVKNKDHKYHFAPKSTDEITGIPDIRAVPRMGKRSRWKDKQGNIYEWDYQHGALEKYDRQGKHLGQYDPKTGIQQKPPVPGRKTPK